MPISSRLGAGEGASVSAQMQTPSNGILLAMYLGMRREEVCGLTWAKVFYRPDGTSELTIDQVYTTVDGQNILRQGAKNDASIGTVLASESITKLLKQRQTYIGQIVSSLKSVDSARDISISDLHIIGDDHLEPIKPQRLGRSHKLAMEKSGIEHIVRFHDLRHTFATIMLTQGAPIQSVSKILRHSNISTTMNLYFHPNIEHQAEITNGFVDTIYNNNSLSTPVE